MNQKSNTRNHTLHFTLHTSQKGITLIALVVTILVMLILAGVVINMVTGDEGIISQSKLANKQQIEKEDMEAIKLAVSGQDMAEAMEDVPAGYNDNNKADEIQKELRTKYNGAIVTNEGNNSFLVKIDPTDKKRWYTVPANRKIAKVGETATSNPTTTSVATSNPTSTATVTPTPTSSNQISITELTAGTYVNYIDNNGNTIPCVILYDTAYNTTNGTNYGIQVISANPVKQVTLGSTNFETARVSYNSAISTLNREARTYLNTNYATAARCVGSLPSSPNSEGVETESAATTYPFIGVEVDFGTYRQRDENYIEDYTQMENLNIIFEENTCWLASRNWFSDAGITFYYCVRVINGDFETQWGESTVTYGEPIMRLEPTGEIINNIDQFANYTLTGFGKTYGLRPVITLKNTLKTNGGSGTANSPYNLTQ